MELFKLCQRRGKIELQELKDVIEIVGIDAMNREFQYDYFRSLKREKTIEIKITPFHCLCKNSGINGFNLDMLKYCVETCKADMNFKGIFGSTPFAKLCSNSGKNGFNLEMLKYCIEVGKADINLKIISRPFTSLCRKSDKNGFDLNMLKYCIGVVNVNMMPGFYLLCKYNVKHRKQIMMYLGKNNLMDNFTINRLLKKNIISSLDKLKYFTNAVIINPTDTHFQLY